MTAPHDILCAALTSLDTQPLDSASRPANQKYSQQVSEKAALAIAQELRQRGLHGTRPALPSEPGLSSAERRIAGGIDPRRT